MTNDRTTFTMTILYPGGQTETANFSQSNNPIQITNNPIRISNNPNISTDEGTIVCDK